MKRQSPQLRVPPKFVTKFVQIMSTPISDRRTEIIADDVQELISLGFSARPPREVLVDEVHPRDGILRELKARVGKKPGEGLQTPVKCYYPAREMQQTVLVE